ncbi:ribosomal protein S18 acetylase RimI-like enzyme [Kribbella orskensis]|uniref:Ribosomal protein S18 acetylase RimI-like enzyme n=1 Tax=Kribbella orskensis TaxID=2512216 RepID=A0ABY2BGL5_9ACTN|nr:MULTISPECIES: GNAT family N-acetyltransferase [Kribbella]TCN38047.1 ribosomal protein S18 acetylase RimI-like enzyme [Kribbella sp. VKM Ac-2500]TCO19534.1 ribosomal protein S18 acetylase RimI-like enzyme [Kribbella orskensis]
MNGFAAYDPEASRHPANDVISVRGARAADLAVCAELIVSRTGGPAEERVERLQGDLEDPERYVAVACAGSGADEQVVGYGGVIRHERLPEHPADTAPSGYFLIGLIVAAGWRRHGIGELLTLERMRWTAERADSIWYFANLANGAILDLHERFGFEEVTRDFTFPGAPLQPGTCVLLRAPLVAQWKQLPE